MHKGKYAVSALYLGARGRLLSYYSRATIIAVAMEGSGVHERLIPGSRMTSKSSLAPHEVLVIAALPQDSERPLGELEKWIKEQRAAYNGKLAFYAVEESHLRELH